MSKAIANKVLIVVLHVCGWALLFMLPFRFLSHRAFFVSGQAAQPLSPPKFFSEPLPFDPMLMKYETVLTNCLLAIFFYTNMFFLIPRIQSRKGWGQYIAVVGLVLVIYLSIGYLFRITFIIPPGAHFSSPFLIGVPNFLMVFALSLALRMKQDKSAYENLLKEQENERLKSELVFLRSQVTPHFMFNVLNSLASLARKKSDQVESAVIQLSQLMRYTLYHSNKKVSLAQEAEYISNYINLQKLRFGATVNMHFHVDIEQKDMLIEPMLLVPFVENAFKHGVGIITDPVIIIILEARTCRLQFTVRNKFNASFVEGNDPASGIGLTNVRRRLDLLYQHQYSLDTYATEGQWFVADLKLKTA